MISGSTDEDSRGGFGPYMPGLHKYILEITANIEPSRPITDSPEYMEFMFETASDILFGESDTKWVFEFLERAHQIVFSI